MCFLYVSDFVILVHLTLLATDGKYTGVASLL